MHLSTGGRLSATRTLHGAAYVRLLEKWRASALHAQVEWPLNMVVDRSTQNLYQALLRHLLGLAMVERELHIIWRTYQSTRALFRCAHSSHRAACQQQCHMMFAGACHVLCPCWRRCSLVELPACSKWTSACLKQLTKETSHHAGV